MAHFHPNRFKKRSGYRRCNPTLRNLLHLINSALLSPSTLYRTTSHSLPMAHFHPNRFKKRSGYRRCNPTLRNLLHLINSALLSPSTLYRTTPRSLPMAHFHPNCFKKQSGYRQCKPTLRNLLHLINSSSHVYEPTISPLTSLKSQDLLQELHTLPPLPLFGQHPAFVLYQVRSFITYFTY
jgi:hypothetical protein